MSLFEISKNSLNVALGPGDSLRVKTGCVSAMSGSLKISQDLRESRDRESQNRENRENYNVIENLTNRTLKCIVGSHLPGQIVEISLTPDRPWVVIDSAILAATPDVVIESGYNLKDSPDSLFDKEVVSLSRISLRESRESGGRVFVSAFGKSTRNVVEEGDSLLINSNLFLAAPLDALNSYKTVESQGNRFSAVGCSWSLMKFESQESQREIVVLTQSHGIEALARKVVEVHEDDDDLSDDDESSDESQDDDDESQDDDEDESEESGDDDDDDDESEDDWETDED